MDIKKIILILIFFHFNEASKKKNIVLILTDDQDIHLKSVGPMKNVQQLIANKGATFKNVFVTTPVCCPSRSSILTGLYVHNHHTVNNSISGGCSSQSWQQNFENNTFASVLHEAGYKTFYAGKYLNEYGNRKVGGAAHIPPGWDWWVGLLGNSVYYNYSLSINGTEKVFGQEYLTDVLNNYAMEFLNQKTIEEKPFLMVVSTPAPHSPFTPADRHKNSLPNVKVFRTPAFNYSKTYDKHWLLRMVPIPLPTEAMPLLDSIQRQRLQTLLAVDDIVRNIVKKLEETNLIDDTYIIYTSDNGFHIGQFCQFWDKRQPYETDISVPLFIRGPNIPRKSVISYPVANIDLAPTIVEMANVVFPTKPDGVSFLKILKNPKNYETFNRSILVEYWGEENNNLVSENCPWKYDTHLTECYENFWCKCQDASNNTYSCVRHLSKDDNILLCNFEDNENFIEIYNIKHDQYQLRNLAKNENDQLTAGYSKYFEILENVKVCTGSACHSL